MKEVKCDFNDISLIPDIKSSINTRKECDIYIDGNLPLYTAPMDTIISNENIEEFLKNRIIPCVSRNIQINDKIHRSLYFKAFGLNEIEKQFQSNECSIDDFYRFPNIIIDTANGNMERLFIIIKKIKNKYPDITIMGGNIANPITFKLLSNAGCDIIRLGIGGGSACLTSVQTGIYYPLASLIMECAEIKKNENLSAKILIDGGIKNYSDIIKSLGIGASGVMIGSIFNKSMQSAGFNYLYGFKIPYSITKILWKWGFPIKKKYRGMSTKAVQRKWGKTKLVTAEGITKYQKVEYNLSQWTENFEDYLRSCMSYCGARNLEEFIGEAEWVFITDAARTRFQK